MDELFPESGESCHAWNCNGCEITPLDRRGGIGRKKKRRFGNWWEKDHREAYREWKEPIGQKSDSRNRILMTTPAVAW